MNDTALTNSSTDEWSLVEDYFEDKIGKRPELEGVLFLIGVQELGKGIKVFTKEEKQELMHIGVCTLLSAEGYFNKTETDADGWPHYQRQAPLPPLSQAQQEEWLKQMAVKYVKQLIAQSTI